MNSCVEAKPIMIDSMIEQYAASLPHKTVHRRKPHHEHYDIRIACSDSKRFQQSMKFNVDEHRASGPRWSRGGRENLELATVGKPKVVVVQLE
ncbi:hypothetical protein GUITHDRAFT_151130 [Guillardia theta CCMP2712]|uniref:Uncharacterized protein n=1 Tax=Guillardia theta (strain CCMP2712) TaxID=905079 RepID=L1JRC9_GUITC|nr:hypothetical protein GUITHDRAFT_151130 [Guillardia theta CCMP2712]EKX51007.1 hypothetical protein GUITHDRAFT_151130 [Guillardia theta CCMP2712]|eukprot:XP_005837987.1 hypothetical protein GUITHDRAFT_151130 [Guillardia theta CCMP2712]